jgi:exodeoxyribonuclease-3
MLRVFAPAGYHRFFRDASTKKGYSGVAIYSRREPDEVRSAIGWSEFDDEGRYIEARFGNLSIVSLYLPSGSSGDARQQFKFRVLDWIAPIFAAWAASGRDYVLCGDWNIVRSRQDIRNWASNQKNSGCLPEERAWLNALCEKDWVDAYRAVHPQGEDYSWWSARGAARANNVGWRIDYQMVTAALSARLKACSIHPEQQQDAGQRGERRQQVEVRRSRSPRSARPRWCRSDPPDDCSPPPRSARYCAAVKRRLHSAEK